MLELQVSLNSWHLEAGRGGEGEDLLGVAGSLRRYTQVGFAFYLAGTLENEFEVVLSETP